MIVKESPGPAASQSSGGMEDVGPVVRSSWFSDVLVLASASVAAFAETELVRAPWSTAAFVASLFLVLGVLVAREDTERLERGDRDCWSRLTVSVLAPAVAVGLGGIAVAHRSGLLLFLSVTMVLAAVFAFAGRRRKAEVALRGWHVAAVLGGTSIAAARFLSLGSADAAVLAPAKVATWILDRLAIRDATVLSPFLVLEGVRINVSLILRPHLLAVPVAFAAVFPLRSPAALLRLLVAWAISSAGLVVVTVWISLTAAHAAVHSDVWLTVSAVASAVATVLLWRPEGLRRLDLRAFALTYALVGAALLLTAVMSSRLGPPSRPITILIDEGHGRWETVAGSVDTLQYGRASSYNYVLLRTWLEERYRVRVLEEAVPESLEGDVLLVKVPTVRYDRHEIQRIEQWVRKGGVLIVIGDHTNLFGSTWIANDILRPYGLRMRDDATVPLRGPDYAFRSSWWTAFFPLRPLGDVPLQTGCSVEAKNPRAEPLTICRGGAAEAAEYSSDRFFGDLEVSPDDRAGPFAVGAYVPHGRGSVIVFGDSTIWSSFCFFSPPYKELLDRLVGIGLARPARMQPWIWLFAATLCAGRFWIGGGRSRSWALATGILFLLWSPLGLTSGRAWNREGAPGRPRELLVDLGVTRLNLSTDIRTGRNVDLGNYAAFLGLLPRIGVWPEFRQVEYDELHGDERVLLLCPDRKLPARKLAAMESFVRRGGTILLFLDATTSWPPGGHELLERFGGKLDLEVVREQWSGDGGPCLPRLPLGLPFTLAYAARRQPAPGGQIGAGLKAAILFMDPILLDADGLCIYARRRIGRGTVYAFARPTAFSQYMMGDVWMGVDVDPLKRDVYRLACEIVGALDAHE